MSSFRPPTHPSEDSVCLSRLKSLRFHMTSGASCAYTQVAFCLSRLKSLRFQLTSGASGAYTQVAFCLSRLKSLRFQLTSGASCAYTQVACFRVVVKVSAISMTEVNLCVAILFAGGLSYPEMYACRCVFPCCGKSRCAFHD